MRYHLAQSINIGGQSVNGPLDPKINSVGALINQILLFLIPAASIILLLVLIWGGYDYIMSQGNPEKIKGAQAKITSGIIGFVLLVFAYLIVRVISTIIGLGGGLF